MTDFVAWEASISDVKSLLIHNFWGQVLAVFSHCSGSNPPATLRCMTWAHVPSSIGSIPLRAKRLGCVLLTERHAQRYGRLV